MTRKRMPNQREGKTHTVTIHSPTGSLDLTIIVGEYKDGRFGELFIKIGGMELGGQETWAILLSLLLQYGVPFEVIYKKLAFMQYEPAGMTDNPDIPFAKSIPDYVVRWLAKEYNLDVVNK